MKKSILFSALVSIFSYSGMTQTMMIEMDESLTGKKHELRTISVKDGEVKKREFEDISEAKIEMVKAIEAMNMVQLTVSEYTTTEYDVKDDVFIRYSFVLTLDMSMGPPMPGGMPGQEGMPGMEGMPNQSGGGPAGMPPPPPQQSPK